MLRHKVWISLCMLGVLLMGAWGVDAQLEQLQLSGRENAPQAEANELRIRPQQTDNEQVNDDKVANDQTDNEQVADPPFAPREYIRLR